MGKSSGIGGQAVIEGVMMRNGERYSVAVRTPDGKIEVIEKDYGSSSKKYPILRLPLLRGVAAFIDSMRVGISTLTYSSSFYEEDEEEEDGLSKVAKKVFKDKAEKAITALSLVFAFVIAIGLFVFIPYAVSRAFSSKIDSTFALNSIEGLTRLLIFIVYVFLISRLKDIKRVFMYHGAEHKSINCIENGYPLTVENVRRASRFHKRCGTSFMFFVMIISIIIFIFIQTDYRWLNLLLRVILVPLVAGISYEILKFAGNHSGVFVNILSSPGLLMQRFTVNEPDDDMIEVAIAAVEQVFDWKTYLERQEEEMERLERLKKNREALVLASVSDDEDDDSELYTHEYTYSDDGMFSASDDFSDIEFVDLDDINSLSDIDDIFESDPDSEDPYMSVSEYVAVEDTEKSKKHYKNKKHKKR